MRLHGKLFLQVFSKPQIIYQSRGCTNFKSFDKKPQWLERQFTAELF
jgi:hypothetical protein